MKVRLKPTDSSLVIPDPSTGKPIGPEGIEVKEPLSKYWKRRLRDGDMVKAVSAPARPRVSISDKE